MSVAERFAANLIRIRRNADLSQEDLALMASLHRTEISQLERAQRVPRIDTVVKLAASLEVDAGELLDGIEWRLGAARPGRFELDDGD